MKKYIKPFFILYCLVMLWLLFGQRMGRTGFADYAVRLRQNINLVPFDTVKLFWKAAGNSDGFYWIWQAVRNIAGNVVLFIPLGLLSCIFTKLRSFPKYIVTVFLIITAVEILQFFTLLGSCDIDDLILNLIGASAGFCLIRGVENFITKKII